MVGSLGEIAEFAMCTMEFQIIPVVGSLGEIAEIAMCTIGGPDCKNCKLDQVGPTSFQKNVFPKYFAKKSAFLILLF